MGNQTFCNCIALKNKNETLKVENENIIKYNERIYNDDLSKTHLMEKNFNFNKFKKSKNFDFNEFPKLNEKRRYSFHDPQLSFVTIHFKTNKKI